MSPENVEKRQSFLLLLTPQKGDEFVGYRSGLPNDRRPEEARQSCETAYEKRSLGQTLKALESLEDGFTAKGIIHSSLAKLVSHQIVAFPSGPVMGDSEFRKRFSRPAHHSRCSLRMPVLAAVFKNGVASDGFVAFSTHQLRGMSHGIHSIAAATPALSFFSLENKTPDNAQSGILLELGDQFPEIRRPYGDVGIQIADKLERDVGQELDAGLQRHYLGTKTSSGGPGYPQEADEWMLFRIPLNDFVGPVLAAVTYDDPPLRQLGLRQHGFNRFSNIFFFVVGRCRQNVSSSMLRGFAHGFPNSLRVLKSNAQRRHFKYCLTSMCALERADRFVR